MRYALLLLFITLQEATRKRTSHFDKESKMDGERKEALPLFETREGKGRVVHRVLGLTIFVGICMIWVYRLVNIPRAGEKGRWAWLDLFLAELWFGFYWIITQSVRWNVVHRFPFKDRLLLRYGDKLPGMDIFVCTADPKMEPPTLVINTVLSAMSYNYPLEKLSIYLSDDGGSELTFYALIEASNFAKHWIPFCNKFKVEPRSPEAYFAMHSEPEDFTFAHEWVFIKKLYEDMKSRINSIVETGNIPKEIKDQHKGFSEWNNKVTKQDHQSIVQIIIDGRDIKAVDNSGCRLPTLVYMAREKRPKYFHNFKAGAMNALIRVSAEISNAPIILNLDCDMYSNNSDTIQEVLCFFMDEKRGHEVAYVQFPQNYDNLTENDVYANCSRVTNGIELAGIGGYGAALYCGTGCFHRRESLCGQKYSKDYIVEWNNEASWKNEDRGVNELEEATKVLANCSYEKNTTWGKEMGLLYGCPVEDIITGLTIQCRGWKSLHYDPEKKGFLGVAPTNLDQALIQYKRWSEGMFQIFASKYCPFLYAHGKIKFGAQMGYCVYLLWAPNSLAALSYVIVPCISLLQGIPLFPEVSSLWFLPFAYVFIASYTYSLAEALICGATIKAWWNAQRMWVIRRTTSFLFAFIDTIIRQLGFSQTSFIITDKVVDENALKRYEQEIMEFGTSSISFIIITTLALLNLFGLVVGIKRVVWQLELKIVTHIVLCGLMVVINLPIYEALIIRNDKGRLPSSVMLKSVILASLACFLPVY